MSQRRSGENGALIKKKRLEKLISSYGKKNEMSSQSSEPDFDTQLELDRTTQFDAEINIDSPAPEPEPTVVPPVAAPEKIESFFMKELDLNTLFELILSKKASELYLSSETPVYLRISGEVVKKDNDILSDDIIREFIEKLCNNEHINLLEHYGEVTFSYELKGISRFRINIFKQFSGYSMIFKRIPVKIPSFKSLNLPLVTGKMALYKSGLVIITGPSGSGKTTTMASIIDYINQNRKALIAILEDSIEFIHDNKKSIIMPFEIDSNPYSYKTVLQDVVKKSPDIICINEPLKDGDDTLLALKAAENGSLVFCCLHIDTVPRAIKRLVDFFPPEKSQYIATRLSMVLKAGMAQKLFTKQDGTGQIIATEVLFNSREIADALRKASFEEMHSIMGRSKKAGMHTMHQSLAELVKQNLLPKEILF